MTWVINTFWPPRTGILWMVHISVPLHFRDPSASVFPSHVLQVAQGANAIKCLAFPYEIQSKVGWYPGLMETLIISVLDRYQPTIMGRLLGSKKKRWTTGCLKHLKSETEAPQRWRPWALQPAHMCKWRLPPNGQFKRENNGKQYDNKHQILGGSNFQTHFETRKEKSSDRPDFVSHSRNWYPKKSAQELVLWMVQKTTAPAMLEPNHHKQAPKQKYSLHATADVQRSYQYFMGIIGVVIIPEIFFDGK